MGRLGFGLLVVLVIVVFALYAAIVTGFIASVDDRAAFGEMFGALSALFSALAFAAVTYSIFLQARQLAHQEQEAKSALEQVELTRNELAKTAKLNALAILAKTYGDSLEWMEQEMRRSGVDKSAAMAKVSHLHEAVVTETEALCGISSGIYAD